MAAIPMDLHVHTHETVDARHSTVDAMCRRAIELGVREIAFTNHVVLGNSSFTISPEAFRLHMADIVAARGRYPGLTIRLGLEVDYFAEREAELRETLEEYRAIAGGALDLVMGSIHHLWGVFYTTHEQRDAFYASHSPEELYSAYFAVLERAAASGLFQVMAHPDAIKKGARRISRPLPWECYREHAERAIDCLVTGGVAVEINTRGLLHACAEMYPSEPFLAYYVERCRASGQEPRVTLGCDSHDPKTFGFALTEGLAYARRMGLTHLCTFQGGRPVPVPLDGQDEQ